MNSPAPVSNDFFERERRSRLRTRLAISLFVLLAACLVLFSALLVCGLLFLLRYNGGWGDPRNLHWYLRPALGTLVIVLTFVGCGAWYRWRRIRGSPEGLARDLRARRLAGECKTPEHRRLIDVVEEMALASGLPVPAVYILPNETAINAFAAGLTPADAGIFVTEGAIEKLKRDELQGLIAHEFGHILNGDMRLNLHLLALVFGVFSIRTAGFILFFWGEEPRQCYKECGNGDVGGVAFVFGIIGFSFGIIAWASTADHEYRPLWCFLAFLASLAPVFIWKESWYAQAVNFLAWLIMRLFVACSIFGVVLPFFIIVPLLILGIDPGDPDGGWMSRLYDKGALFFFCAVLVCPVGIAAGFFGRLFQAVICRQREYLADACALQFTRNPDGLISLLHILGARADAGLMPKAADMAHMLFADGVKSVISTHPRPTERIVALQTPARHTANNPPL